MLQVFIAVGETRGFAAAALRLNLSPAAVTRAIAKLERMLGVELVQRTTRSVRLTEAGQRYLHDVGRVVADIHAINDASTSAPKGQLVVSTPESFGKFYVMPCVAAFMQRFPEVGVVAGFSDRVVDMAQERIDVAIGIGQLRDPGLISTRVGQIRYLLCASPAYLERHGTPNTPVDLLHHAVIGRGAAFQPTEWNFDSAAGRMSMRLRARLTVTTDDVAIAAAASGLGVARLLSYQAEGLIREGKLRVVLHGYAEAARPVHVLRRERYRSVPKVCQFVHLLVERLARDASLQ